MIDPKIQIATTLLTGYRNQLNQGVEIKAADHQKIVGFVTDIHQAGDPALAQKYISEFKDEVPELLQLSFAQGLQNQARRFGNTAPIFRPLPESELDALRARAEKILSSQLNVADEDYRGRVGNRLLELIREQPEYIRLIQPLLDQVSESYPLSGLAIIREIEVAAEPLLPRVIQLAEQGSPKVRVAAIRTLPYIGGPRTRLRILQVLHHLQSNLSDFIQIAAHRSLWTLNPGVDAQHFLAFYAIHAVPKKAIGVEEKNRSALEGLLEVLDNNAPDLETSSALQKLYYESIFEALQALELRYQTKEKVSKKSPMPKDLKGYYEMLCTASEIIRYWLYPVHPESRNLLDPLAYYPDLIQQEFEDPSAKKKRIALLRLNRRMKDEMGDIDPQWIPALRGVLRNPGRKISWNPLSWLTGWIIARDNLKMAMQLIASSGANGREAVVELVPYLESNHPMALETLKRIAPHMREEDVWMLAVGLNFTSCKVVQAVLEVLEQCGPQAKGALPKLVHIWHTRPELRVSILKVVAQFEKEIPDHFMLQIEGALQGNLSQQYEAFQILRKRGGYDQKLAQAAADFLANPLFYEPSVGVLRAFQMLAVDYLSQISVEALNLVSSQSLTQMDETMSASFDFFIAPDSDDTFVGLANIALRRNNMDRIDGLVHQGLGVADKERKLQTKGYRVKQGVDAQLRDSPPFPVHPLVASETITFIEKSGLLPRYWPQVFLLLKMERPTRESGWDYKDYENMATEFDLLKCQIAAFLLRTFKKPSPGDVGGESGGGKTISNPSGRDPPPFSDRKPPENHAGSVAILRTISPVKKINPTLQRSQPSLLTRRMPVIGLPRFARSARSFFR